METIKNIKTEISKTQLENNYNQAINRIYDVCDHNDWVIKINAKRCTEDGLSIHSIKPNFDNLSRNARKNVAKRLYNYHKKDSLKTMNTLFFILYKLGVIDVKVSVSVSDKEKAINRLRVTYKAMKTKALEAQIAYKSEKGDFYKKKLAQ